jgi:hypothetical protein
MGDILERLDKDSHGFDFHIYRFKGALTMAHFEVAFERVHDYERGIWCEASVKTEIDDATLMIVPPSRINLLSVNRSSGWRSLLDACKAFAHDVDWETAINPLIGETISIHRSVDTDHDLDKVEEEIIDPYLLKPFIASSGVSVLYGEGGLGKSLLALGMALSVTTGKPLFGEFPKVIGPVIYADYEDDSSVHASRLKALRNGMNVEKGYPIHHVALISKVANAQAELRRKVEQRNAVMLILDSIGMGRGGDATGAEDTIRLFRALRSLDVPVLAVDHVTKDDKRSGKTDTPYGSVYTINSARLLWAGRLASQPNDPEKLINLENTKANHTQIHRPMALKVNYVNARTKDDHEYLSAVTITSHNEWWEEREPDVWAGIVMTMTQQASRAWTVKELAVALGTKSDTIQKACQRHPDELVKEKAGRSFTYQLTEWALKMDGN